MLHHPKRDDLHANRATLLASVIAVLTLMVVNDGAVLRTPLGLHANVVPHSQLTMEGRIARRLQYRIGRHHPIVPPLSQITQAVQKRQDLLQQQSTVTILDSERQEHAVWDVSPQRYPTWIRPEISPYHFTFQFSPEAIAETLKQEVVPTYEAATHVRLDGVEQDGDVMRIKTGDLGKPGQSLPLADASVQIAEALESNNPATLTLQAVDPVLVSQHTNFPSLRLLGTGRSNFRGSTIGRTHNVRKALEEHVNNVVVAPGETFSFNQTLNGPVSQSYGWALAKIISGGELEFAPGGGICQASTTVYRAILEAGLPVRDRRAHTLYVSYYRHGGVGLDATIYPNQQDLTFENDTSAPIVIQAYTDGHDAIVNFYGIPDGREVELDGPYFAQTAPEDLWVEGRKLTPKEIAWTNRVTYPDGEVREEVVLSRYRSLPEHLVHAAAL